ncbi:MAG: hypothetical protein FRX48_05939 [Lasallia pustulata]|uniref:Uncharacterized protein n=1 Tax=Lasallia pustulata TaxID=136370 RepID=A0A5M8PLW0_9LECA|nr:MAG: hypothetical protein FRX48_05939 [Lasallia pustulata]
MYVSRLSLGGQYNSVSEPTWRKMPYKSRFSRHLFLPPMDTPSTDRDRKPPRASRLPHSTPSKQAQIPQARISIRFQRKKMLPIEAPRQLFHQTAHVSGL